MEYDYLFRILLMGISGVGKSSTLISFIHQHCDEYLYYNRIDGFGSKMIEINDKKINLEMWDKVKSI